MAFRDIIQRLTGNKRDYPYILISSHDKRDNARDVERRLEAELDEAKLGIEGSINLETYLHQKGWPDWVRHVRVEKNREGKFTWDVVGTK